VHIKLGRYGRGRDVGRVTDGDLVEHNAGEMTGHAVCYRSEIIVAWWTDEDVSTADVGRFNSMFTLHDCEEPTQT